MTTDVGEVIEMIVKGTQSVAAGLAVDHAGVSVLYRRDVDARLAAFLAGPMEHADVMAVADDIWACSMATLASVGIVIDGLQAPCNGVPARAA